MPYACARWPRRFGRADNDCADRQSLRRDWRSATEQRCDGTRVRQCDGPVRHCDGLVRQCDGPCDSATVRCDTATVWCDSATVRATVRRSGAATRWSSATREGSAHDARVTLALRVLSRRTLGLSHPRSEPSHSRTVAPSHRRSSRFTVTSSLSARVPITMPTRPAARSAGSGAARARRPRSTTARSVDRATTDRRE